MYMNNKYYSLKEQLQNIKNRCSKTYENSLLYQKEILDFKGIANLQEQYQFINQEISNIRLNFQENNYSHLFSSLNEIYNNFLAYDIKLNEFATTLRSASNLTYDNFLLEFNTNVRNASRYLDSAKNHLDSYNRYNYTLSNLAVNDPNYNDIKNKKATCYNNFYLEINKVPIIFEDLESLLKKGLKKI